MSQLSVNANTMIKNVQLSSFKIETMVVENKTKRATLCKALGFLRHHVTQRPLLASALYLTLRQSKHGNCRVSYLRLSGWVTFVRVMHIPFVGRFYCQIFIWSHTRRQQVPGSNSAIAMSFFLSKYCFLLYLWCMFYEFPCTPSSVRKWSNGLWGEKRRDLW